MEGTEKILNRIKKMLALANDAAASEGERENALRMAHNLMAKHNLDMATVESSGGSAEKREEHSSQFFGRPWGRSVAGSVAKMLFCEYLVNHVGGEKSKIYRHRFIGRTSNAVTAAELSKYLVESITRESRQRYGASGSSEGRTFCLGAAAAIRERVFQIIKESTQPSSISSSSGTALVLASVYRTEHEANQALMLQMYPKLRTLKSSGKGVTSTEAYHAGRQYGSTVSLNRQVK